MNENNNTPLQTEFPDPTAELIPEQPVQQEMTFEQPQPQTQPQPQQQAYTQPAPQQQMYTAPPQPTKFCKFCGQSIHMEAVLCTKCGRQVEAISGQNAAPVAPQVVINNANSNVNTNTNNNNNGMFMGKEKNKWVALVLCILFGYWGVHRFYEGKIGTGILWLFTLGFCGVGIIIDLIIILLKPNPYYVR
ncbi:MAG: TM2 domain-containing protein [Oscillospiraceae bacterium]|nr:TM2 domain-containing protein [Oscillospiraceae bacterium]